ncbi:hypothetical protein DPMN_167331 [Dreissena polymorpha]|uniref:Uncharacterized protein n=1 Tax=Dreissena polymorpha TaxID=45954 RepID=A0A9D4EYL7_DREPO|nr:hypothetical protein DPMN_167331 [Dreissena polymorpha]
MAEILSVSIWTVYPVNNLPKAFMAINMAKSRVRWTLGMTNEYSSRPMRPCLGTPRPNPDDWHLLPPGLV